MMDMVVFIFVWVILISIQVNAYFDGKRIDKLEKQISNLKYTVDYLDAELEDHKDEWNAHVP